MTVSFAAPLAFTVLGALVLWGAAAQLRRRRTQSVLLPSFHRLRGAGVGFRVRIRLIPSLLRLAALVSLTIAIARPQERIPRIESTKDAVALQLVVDRSGSMDELAVFEGQTTRRIDAVKEVVQRFVIGDGRQLPGRAGDLIGLVVFGTYADTLVPLTQSHGALVETLARVELPRIERERSTAIGDALMLAAARLRASEDAMRAELEDDSFELKSKAILLLTDGENRAGQFDPREAARLAREWGVKIYIIGIRGGYSETVGGIRMRLGQDIDEQEMQAVAAETGGGFWPVDDLSQLDEVYARIDELERTTIRVSESTDIEELFVPFLAAALGFLALELLAAWAVGGRLP